MDTSDRETLRMAVQRLNRLEDKVDDHLKASAGQELPELHPLTGETLVDLTGPRFVRIGEYFAVNVETIRCMWAGEPFEQDGEELREVRVVFTDGTEEIVVVDALPPNPLHVLVGSPDAAPEGGEQDG